MTGVNDGNSKLVKLRTRLSLTQKDLATALGVTEQTVRNWEHGKANPRLSIRQVKELCRLLECSIEELPECFGPS